MGKYVLGIGEVDRTRIAAVGGKGANLGDLSRLDWIEVPDGFCVTTDAFERVAPEIAAEVAALGATEIRTASAAIRRHLEELPIPDDVAAEITDAVEEQVAYAVRSSATAEDLPGASFAGQQDSYLNIVGHKEILTHVSRCWASLFTERAVLYRQRNGFDHRAVRMAVVVQRMVDPQASGVLFTADPVTGNRTVACVEATPGLGEALVSGLVNADRYQVRAGEVVERAGQRTLTDEQVLRLVRLGRRIEAHFGRPQDIEWCLAGDTFQIVQSRPITTLFPVPEAADDTNRVYLSVGHQQMMTDAMKPLGLSVWQLTTPRPMAEAGGRLFVDVTAHLSVPASRAALLDVSAKSDPLIADALRTVLDRDGFLPVAQDETPAQRVPGATPTTIDTDPAIVTELIDDAETSIAALDRELRGKSGTELLDFVLADFQELKRLLFAPRSNQVVMAGTQATWWLNEHLLAWLGEKNAADAVSQSAPHNVTSEMGLALLDVADAIRPHPAVVAFLSGTEDDDFLAELDDIDGGSQARQAIEAYLDKYGRRCVGEIDITRPRWSERPAALLPMLLANVRNFAPGDGQRRFEQGRQEAAAAEADLLRRVRALPDGEQKAEETQRAIARVRTFIGYREYPKYGMISRYFLYKKALLAEADRLVAAGVLADREDVYFLRFDELAHVVRTGEVDHDLIAKRRKDFRTYEALTPPRVLTSEGEALTGAYRRSDLPADALAGLPVSAGTVEGRARVVLDLADADLEPGDILVTPHTDPSWSPLFVAAAGLVTEVGGLMTHGAVVAREYGLPAVVGVEGATQRIRDGQWVRVDGTDGYVVLH